MDEHTRAVDLQVLVGRKGGVERGPLLVSVGPIGPEM
jgi:hypothetical protein